MPQPRVKAVLGFILVALGVPLVAASVAEQAPPLKTAANRFYSQVEAARYTEDVQLLQAHAFSKMGRAPLGDPGGSELTSLVPTDGAAESENSDAPDATPTAITAASERVMASREKQVVAWANQKTLSRALLGTGIAMLCAGAMLLISARGVRQSAQ